MDLEVHGNRPRPSRGVGQATVAGGPAWDWDIEIAAAIAMVARDPRCRVVLCSGGLTGRVLAGLDEPAANAGVVLERRIRPGGGWDVVVRSA